MKSIVKHYTQKVFIKKIYIVLSLCNILLSNDTFSIVAVDTLTGQVGSAGASCIQGSIIISDIHPGLGAIHTQSYWNASNQDSASSLMEQGYAPQDIIDWLENFTEEQWDKVVNTNAKGIFMMSKACLPLLIKSKGTILNIVSNAAHMPMTCSLAYNASKGAAHIMTLQLARELTKKHGITVFGIAPNKLCNTQMSKSIDEQVVKTRGWTKEHAVQYQLNGLLTGQETPPELVADFISYLLKVK